MMRAFNMTVPRLFALFALCSFVFTQAANSYDGPWRKTLDGEGSCWSSTVSECNRALTTSHGGDWDLQHPYDSFPAFENAFNNGADAVKGDFRVSMDNIGMIMHSSPIEFYESLNCRGKYVEKMTAAECEQCKMEITDYTFISAPTLLEWAADKVNVMLCVKESTDIPRAITTLIENNATHRAFLEIGYGELLSLEANNVPYWDQVYYVVELSNSEQVMQLVTNSSKTLLSRAFLFEFNSWDDWGDSLKSDIDAVHAGGRRAFAATKDSPVTATVNNHLDLYNAGFDVAYTYNLANAVEARIEINTGRGLVPP
jgi:glycerophosphoryl diester phosphodiesterase